MQIKFWYSIPLLILLFLPVFLNHFGVHTDGYFFATAQKWIGDPEGVIMFKQGRPFADFINSFIGWHFVRTVNDLTILRISVFLIKLIIGFALYRFCRRLQMGELSAVLLPLGFVLLPSNIINVLWVCNGIPETAGLLCGVLSYVTLDKCKSLKPGWGVFFAAILFLTALLFYQPMAVIVFGLMFIKLLFDKGTSGPQLRLRIIKEVLLYGAVLIVYWLLTKYLILPFSRHLYFTVLDSRYQMDLVANIFTKIPMLMDVIRYSLMGTWDLVLHNYILGEWLLMAAFLLITAFFYFQHKFFSGFPGINVFAQKLIFSFGLFLLANVPALMAINCVTVGGYRTFLASSLMGLSFIIYAFKYLSNLFKNNKTINALIVFYLVSVVLVAAWAIYQSVRNYCREYNYIDDIAAHIDYHKTNKVVFVLNRMGESVIEYDLPFEFGYMTTTVIHVRYIFNKYNQNTNPNMEYTESFFGWPLYIDPSSQVVDLTKLRGWQRITYAKPANTIQMSTSDPDIAVQQFDNTEGSPLLKFIQKDGDFWQIKPGNPGGIVDYHFMDVPEMILGYRLKAACINNEDKPCSFLWMVQGSDDNSQWHNLSLQAWGQSDGSLNGNTFAIPRCFPLRYLRFFFHKQNTNDLLMLAAIQLKDIEIRK